MNEIKQRRHRGLILTTEGWQKFQTRQQDWANEKKFGSRYTLEELSELTGLAYNTVLKVIERKKGVDKRTLVKFLMAFDLELSLEDYTSSKSLKKSGNQLVLKKVNWDKPVELSCFFGRTTELATLEKWLMKDRCRLVTVRGIGGIGKTVLCAKLIEQVQQQFDHIVWRSLENAPLLKELLTDLNQVLSDSTQIENNIAFNTGDYLRQLIDYLQSHRCLIVLDSIDNIMPCGTRCGNFLQQHQEYSQLIRHLGEVLHQSCLLLITREQPKEVSFQEGEDLPVRSLELAGLEHQAAKKVLFASNLSGTETEKNKLIKKYSSHPLALKIIAEKTHHVFNGEISQFIRQDTTLIKEIYQLLNQQIERLSSLEYEILYRLANCPEPVSLSTLRQNIYLSVSSQSILESLESLLRRSLIIRKPGILTVQNIINQYFTYFQGVEPKAQGFLACEVSCPRGCLSRSS